MYLNGHPSPLQNAVRFPASSLSKTIIADTIPAEYATLARLHTDVLLARQSKTLKQATARYTLKNNRPPPPGFDKFFKFAQQKGCLIDEYDKVRVVRLCY
jgi:hypothetical protein